MDLRDGRSNREAESRKKKLAVRGVVLLPGGQVEIPRRDSWGKLSRGSGRPDEKVPATIDKRC